MSQFVHWICRDLPHNAWHVTATPRLLPDQRQPGVVQPPLGRVEDHRQAEDQAKVHVAQPE